MYFLCLSRQRQVGVYDNQTTTHIAEHNLNPTSYDAKIKTHKFQNCPKYDNHVRNILQLIPVMFPHNGISFCHEESTLEILHRNMLRNFLLKTEDNVLNINNTIKIQEGS
jgi:hypothetical protein